MTVEATEPSHEKKMIFPPLSKFQVLYSHAVCHHLLTQDGLQTVVPKLLGRPQPPSDRSSTRPSAVSVALESTEPVS